MEKNKKRRKISFYRGLYIAFLIGLLAIGIFLLLFFNNLTAYEKTLEAEAEARKAEHERLVAEAEAKRIAAEEEAARIAAEEEARRAAEEAEEAARLAAEEAAKNPAEYYGPTYPITPEEEEQVRSTAEAFTKAYAVFSTKRDAGGGTTLSYVAKDTDLHTRLARYTNEWGIRYSKDSFDKLDITDIKKTNENPAEYYCKMDCVYTITADNGTKRSYDLNFAYMMRRDDASGKLLITDMMNR